MTHAVSVMRARARELLLECIGRGRDVSHDSLQAVAREKYANDTPYVEREEIITQALELHVAEQRGDPVDDRLTTAELRMHAADFFRANPQGTSLEAWNYVRAQGKPALKKSSFQKFVAVEVRRELGIVWKGGAGKKGGRAKTKTAPARPNGRPERDHKSVGEAEAEANGGAGNPGTDPERRQTREDSTDEAPAGAQRPTAESESHGAPAEATRASNDPRVKLAAVPGEASHEGPAGPAAAPDDDRDRIVLETPGGSVTATHEVSDMWLVQFDGLMKAEVLHLLVADLIGPFTGAKNGARS